MGWISNDSGGFVASMPSGDPFIEGIMVEVGIPRRPVAAIHPSRGLHRITKETCQYCGSELDSHECKNCGAPRARE